MIYLDNAATTQPSHSTAVLCKDFSEKQYFNPSALYYPASQLKSDIENSRSIIAGKLKCKSNEVIFTSGATESNNWVFNNGIKNKKGNVIISAGEHPSVYEPALFLKNKGVDVRIAPLTEQGTIDIERLTELIDDNTALISVIHVSNETGTVNEIERIAALSKKKNPRLVFHSDGVQAFCKVPICLETAAIDLYSISAHKIGGLKGIGALYAKSGFNISPLLLGGGQENRLRSGTENTLGILSFGTAIEDFDKSEITAMYDCAISALSRIPDVKINGNGECNSKFIISVGIAGVKSEILQHILCDNGVLVGLGSACSSKIKNNRVLSNMKVSDKFIEGNVRISFSPQNNLSEVATAMEILISAVESLRRKIHG